MAALVIFSTFTEKTPALGTNHFVALAIVALALYLNYAGEYH